MEFGVPLVLTYHKTACTDLRWHIAPWALTYPEKHHHAEHWQQGRDHHTEESGEFLRALRLRLLLHGPLPGTPRVLVQGLAGRRAPRLGLIDAGG